jgi:hypothetical protein
VFLVVLAASAPTFVNLVRLQYGGMMVSQRWRTQTILPTLDPVETQRRQTIPCHKQKPWCQMRDDKKHMTRHSRLRGYRKVKRNRDRQVLWFLHCPVVVPSEGSRLI